MLFAFSDINVEKFEQVSISMANSFGITNKASQSETEELIGSGMLQLPGLEEYYYRLNRTSDNTVSDPNEVDTQKEITKDQELNEALTKLNEKMEEDTASMYDEISDLTKQYNLSDYIELSIDPDHKYVELTLKGSVLYPSGEAEIKQDSLPILNSIGTILKKFKGYSVEITGHTDNVPMSEESQYKDNNWLSSARALNAAQYLIDKCGIDPATLKYSGRGEYDPIADNATEEGRARNRRIEIKIYNELSTESNIN
jgi:chemotaxis protein MotB